MDLALNEMVFFFFLWHDDFTNDEVNTGHVNLCNACLLCRKCTVKEVYLFGVNLTIQNYSMLDCVTDRRFRMDTCHLLALVL